MNKERAVETVLAHLSEQGGVKDPFGATHMPIYQTATFDLKKQSGEKIYDYTRSDNPTRESLENVFAKVCGGLGAVCTHTGLGAVALLFETVLKAGDQILVENDTYGGTFRMLKVYKERMNIAVHTADFCNHEAVESILKSNKIRLILVESPTNPGLKIIDLKAVAKLARTYGSIFTGDNSLATFYSQKPLELGAHFDLFSTTKYVSGHGSVIGGVLATNDPALLKDLRYFANAEGRSQNPLDVHAVSLGLPTLPLRMNAHQESALKIAQWLENHPKVTRVVYPGLKSHPQHELAKSQMKNFAGVITVDLESVELAEKLVANCELFGEKCSFGTADSRIEIPGKISHASFTAEELAAIGITASTVRLSIGLENTNDLIEDLSEVLNG